MKRQRRVLNDTNPDGNRRGLVLPWHWLIPIGILALSVALRVGDLDAMVNVDMYYQWSKRIVRFITAVEQGDLAGTYQSHHPGVTFMWLVGLLWKWRGVVNAPFDVAKAKMAVWPVLVVGSCFPVLNYGLLRRLLGRRARWMAATAGMLFATEPLFVAHSRNAHLDIMVTTFSWCAVLSALIAKRELSRRWAIVCGIALGLALLTKLSAAGYALGIAAVFLVAIAQPRRERASNEAPNGAIGNASVSNTEHRQRLLLVLLSIVGAALLTVIALWPALWSGPHVVVARTAQGLATEVGKVREFMLFGESGKLRLPFWIYLLIAGYLATPEFLGAGLGLFAWRKRLTPPSRQFIRDGLLATAPLILLISRSNHVELRYVIPMLPVFGTLSAMAIVQCGGYLSMRLTHTAVQAWVRPTLVTLWGALLVSRTLRVAALYPLPITYCAGWTGIDCSSVFRIGWSEGLKEAAQHVARQSAQRGYAATTVFGGAYTGILRMWTPIVVTNDLSEAQLIMHYLPDWQRNNLPSRSITEYLKAHPRQPLAEVKLQGRTYVQLYAGPRY
jgi:4-amino-4-deoxy-L-arabinose transferase-like glycosyltransferase